MYGCIEFFFLAIQITNSQTKSGYSSYHAFLLYSKMEVLIKMESVFYVHL